MFNESFWESTFKDTSLELTLNQIINFTEASDRCKALKMWQCVWSARGLTKLVQIIEWYIPKLKLYRNCCTDDGYRHIPSQRKQAPREAAYTQTRLLSVWLVPAAWSVVTCPVWWLEIALVCSSEDSQLLKYVYMSLEALIKHSSLQIQICRPHSHLLWQHKHSNAHTHTHAQT